MTIHTYLWEDKLNGTYSWAFAVRSVLTELALHKAGYETEKDAQEAALVLMTKQAIIEDLLK